MGTPVLSVCLITYNHVKYVTQAIDSVLAQKVNFPWELVIADDFSTDGTRDVLKDYKLKYPNLIKLILQEKNVGAAENWLQLITAPLSKYIAYFEGDDYWTDPYKLQKQVDYLEANPDFVISFHNVNFFKKGVLERSHLMDKIKGDDFTIKNLASGDISIYTPSVVFKNLLTADVLSLIGKMPIGDYPLWMNLAAKGKLHYHREEMGVYRINETGMWTGQAASERNLTSIKMIMGIIESFDAEVQTILKMRIVGFYKESLSNALGSPDLFEKCLSEFHNHSPHDLAEFLRQQMGNNKEFQKIKKGLGFRVVNKLRSILS
jgi:glycosyltransferase involved in cell wall biosynthesis